MINIIFTFIFQLFFYHRIYTLLINGNYITCILFILTIYVLFLISMNLYVKLNKKDFINILKFMFKPIIFDIIEKWKIEKDV